MLIGRIWVGNPGRNFNYLVACAETGEALLIDHLDAPQCLAAAAARCWRIAQVLNTHEHNDHTAGNQAVLAATGAKLLAHPAAQARVGAIDRPLRHGDTVAVWRSVRLSVLETPGHTRAHVCLSAAAAGREAPVLFCGDTLFHAGVGNCHRGGDPGLLHETVTNVFGPLPDATRVYPGHEYLARNLAFTMDREPDNAAARDLLERIANIAPAAMPVLTLADERRINVFLRLDAPQVIGGLSAALPDLPPRPSSRDVFLGLRLLRDRW